MSKTIGPYRLNPRGDFNPDADPLYSLLDLVSDGGGSFVYINPTPSNEPTSSTSHWQQIASRGTTGPSAYDAAVEGGYTGTEVEFNAANAGIEAAKDAALDAAQTANEAAENAETAAYRIDALAQNLCRQSSQRLPCARIPAVSQSQRHVYAGGYGRPLSHEYSPYYSVDGEWGADKVGEQREESASRPSWYVHTKWINVHSQCQWHSYCEWYSICRGTATLAPFVGLNPSDGIINYRLILAQLTPLFFL